LVTLLGGNSVHIAITRASGGTPTIYLNGISFATTETTNGTPPSWADSITGSNFVIGSQANSQCWVDRIYNARFYSGIALSTVLKEHVDVVLNEDGKEDAVYLR